MRQRVLACLFLSISLTLLQTRCDAEDDDPQLTAVLEVKKEDPKSKKVLHRQLKFKGKLDGFPVGARVDIRFRLQGNRQHIAWYRALVDDNAGIKGNSSLFRKPFAPGVYEVQFWLKIATQSRALRKWFTVNRGWGRNHQELLENVVIRIGTDADRKTFMSKCLADLRVYLKKLDAVYTALAGRVKGNSPQDKAWEKEAVIHNGSLSDVQRSFYKWQRIHVAMPLEKYRSTLNSIQVKSFKLLAGYNKGSTDLDQKLRFTESQIRYLKDALAPAALLEVPGNGDGKKDKNKGD
jgi:hypothetical protein